MGHIMSQSHGMQRNQMMRPSEPADKKRKGSSVSAKKNAKRYKKR
jgi:hypothetical protein